MKASLSARIRSNSEAAPWVIEEVRKLEAEVERLNRELQSHDCAHRDTPGLTHCPLDKPCSLHRIKLLELKLQRIKELA